MVLLLPGLSSVVEVLVSAHSPLLNVFDLSLKLLASDSNIVQWAAFTLHYFVHINAFVLAKYVLIFLL